MLQSSATCTRWYDATTGRFLETSGQGDGGGYAFVPLNPMDLANGELGPQSESIQFDSVAYAALAGFGNSLYNNSSDIRNITDFTIATASAIQYVRSGLGHILPISLLQNCNIVVYPVYASQYLNILRQEKLTFSLHGNSVS